MAAGNREQQQAATGSDGQPRVGSDGEQLAGMWSNSGVAESSILEQQAAGGSNVQPQGARAWLHCIAGAGAGDRFSFR